MGYIILFLLAWKHRFKYFKWLSLLGLCYQLLIEMSFVIQPNRFADYLSSISNVLFVVLVLLVFVFTMFGGKEYGTD